jgi:hypothetical protein
MYVLFYNKKKEYPRFQEMFPFGGILSINLPVLIEVAGQPQLYIHHLCSAGYINVIEIEKNREYLLLPVIFFQPFYDNRTIGAPVDDFDDIHK